MVELKPYILPDARYYKVFIESNGSINVITTSDIDDVDLDGNQWLHLPEHFRLLDVIEDIHVLPGTTVSRVIDIKINVDGTESIFLPPPAVFDYATFYILGYTDN